MPATVPAQQSLGIRPSDLSFLATMGLPLIWAADRLTAGVQPATVSEAAPSPPP